MEFMWEMTCWYDWMGYESLLFLVMDYGYQFEVYWMKMTSMIEPEYIHLLDKYYFFGLGLLCFIFHH